MVPSQIDLGAGPVAPFPAATDTVEGFLLLAEQFGWFGFDLRKGEAAAIALTVVVVSIFPMCFSIVARFAFRRRFQYSLRTLMLVMIAACIGMSWLGRRYERVGRRCRRWRR